MQRSPILRASLVAAAAAVALTAAASTSAATRPRVVLSLEGSHSTAAGRCGDAHPDQYSSVQRGTRLVFLGAVKPAPNRATWHARVLVKRCSGQQYRKVWTGTAQGGKRGAFRVVYTPRLPGLLVVVADFGKHPNVSSLKLRLRVR